MTPDQPQLDFDATTFSPTLADEAREHGMKQAKASKGLVLGLAREIARNYAMRHGEVTADDVQRGLIEYGYTSADLGNAAGSLFRGSEWEFTGRYTKSERVCGHRNLLRIWRLK